jgi:hypothetical protein
MIDKEFIEEYKRINKYLEKLVNDIEKLESKISNLQNRGSDFIKINKSIIKSFWPKKNTWYKIKNDYVKEICDHELRWRYSRCICSDEIIFFKLTKDYSFSKKDLVNNDFNLYCEGNIYDNNMIKLNTYELVIHISQIELTDQLPIRKNIRKEVIDKPCKVYIMHDKNTGYYKIGRSINPVKREKTLQSEKPTIEMIFNFDTMASTEKILHKEFRHKKVRGEWFNIDQNDIDYVINNYSNK